MRGYQMTAFDQAEPGARTRVTPAIPPRRAGPRSHTAVPLAMLPVMACIASSLRVRARDFVEYHQQHAQAEGNLSRNKAAAGTPSVKGDHARCSNGKANASSHAAGSHRPRRARSSATAAVSSTKR